MIAFAAIKAGGYGAFAHALNRRTNSSVGPIKFGLAKTAAGLLTNAGYALTIGGAIGAALDSSDYGTAVALVGLIPIRFVTWWMVLFAFYGELATSRRGLYVASAGVAWSYLLDGAMWFMAHYLAGFPGMTMPLC